MTTTKHTANQGGLAAKVGRFLWHFVQMCLACCVGGVILGVAFFGGAALVGYPDLIGQAPVFSTLVLAVIVAVPMAAWMRFRHHEWRPTLEMAAAPMALGIVLVTAGLLGIVPASGLFESMASLACPSMLVPMLSRRKLYTGSHHAHTAAS